MKLFIDERRLLPEYRNQIATKFPSITILTKPEDYILADGWLVGPHFITEERVKNTPNLRWIQNVYVGYNVVDLDLLKKKNIVFTNARGVFSRTIAEDVLAKILYFKRNLWLYKQHMVDKIWKPLFQETEIADSTVGILGVGSIASEIAKRLKAFDATVIGYREHQKDAPFFDRILTKEEGLHTLLTISDIVVIALPLNDQTKGLLGKEKLRKLKQDAILINIGRGEIIVEEELIALLKERPRFKAALDVTMIEPLPPTSPLWEMENVFITPHNSPHSPTQMQRQTDLFLRNIELYLAKKPLENVVY